jgi:hypothetical protein
MHGTSKDWSPDVNRAQSSHGEISEQQSALVRFVAFIASFLPGGRTFDLGELSDGRVTVEAGRKQPDGTWFWIIDQPWIVAG